jgi:hypothetical protein
MQCNDGDFSRERSCYSHTTLLYNMLYLMLCATRAVTSVKNAMRLR